MLPLQPRSLTDAGLCARHPHPEWWTSTRATEREAAAAVCLWCPVLQPCRAWAAGLPQTDRAVYAGMTGPDRRRARQAPPEPAPVPADGSAPLAA